MVWRVNVLFNEKVEDAEAEGTDERTIMYERYFPDYLSCNNYVYACQSNGCLGGQVYKSLLDGKWQYYCDIV